jgi:hypothetical protein
MRKGYNPNKDKENIKLDYYHQVIIPVYIPTNLDYFKDSLKILKLTVKSLLKTSHKKTFITIINNGSSKEVRTYLESLLESNKIHELIHTVNIGKLNAILKGLSGSNFPLISISDADVFFLNNWQKETYTVFETFPKAGFVNPCPSSKVLKRFTYNVIFDNLFSSNLKFTSVKNPNALKRFAESIGNPSFYNQYHLEQYLTISNKEKYAVIGGGHFVGTYRGEVFNSINQKYTEFSLGGTSENDILDAPVVDNGFWRLSTQDNYAYHMGNSYETWMDTIELNEIEFNIERPVLKEIKNSKISNKIKSTFFSLFLSRKGIWNKFLTYKGLNKKGVKNY